jgi:hypothetical protein
MQHKTFEFIGIRNVNSFLQKDSRHFLVIAHELPPSRESLLWKGFLLVHQFRKVEQIHRKDEGTASDVGHILDLGLDFSWQFRDDGPRLQNCRKDLVLVFHRKTLNALHRFLDGNLHGGKKNVQHFFRSFSVFNCFYTLIMDFQLKLKPSGPQQNGT